MYFIWLEGQFAAVVLQADHISYSAPRGGVLLDVRYLAPASRVGPPVAFGFYVQYHRFPAYVRMHMVLLPPLIYLETGTRAPYMPTVTKIARAYGVPLEELVGEITS